MQGSDKGFGRPGFSAFYHRRHIARQYIVERYIIRGR